MKIRITIFMLIFALICVGCSKTEAPAPAQQAQPEDTAKTAKELTIFSWWTSGGEADGLNELIKMFSEKYPGVKVTNAAVAGGAGTNAKAVLKTRMLGGDAPGTFQVHGGSELIDTWVKTGYMEPITNLFKEQGWMDKFPKGLLDLVSYQGEIYAVPSNVHRGNALWYNKALFEKAGIEVPVTMDDMLKACETFKEKGITALSLASRNKWPVTHLFESLLVAAGGPEFYNDLFAGKIAWTDEKVIKALETMKKLMDYVNTDHAALTWDQASGLVMKGEAAMNVMGDWAKGYYLANGWTQGKDYDSAPTPGTVGVFMVVTDTFGLPKKAPDKKASLGFLEIVGDKDGQVDFNLKKGSIPSRSDVPMDRFDAIAKATMEDFKKDTLVGSCAHGSAVMEAFVTDINDQLGVFIQEKDVKKTAEALEMAAKDAGLR